MVGPLLPSKRSAKRAVALDACRKLHKLQELDDVHLLPVTQVDQIEDDLVDEEGDGTGARSGTSKRKQCYPKTLEKALVNCFPQPGEICFVYVLNFEIINCCNYDKKFYYPNGIENQMAILSSNCMPKVCAFPLVTRAGEMDVRVDGVDSIILSAEQLAKLKQFHRFLIEDVILLFKTRTQRLRFWKSGSRTVDRPSEEKWFVDRFWLGGSHHYDSTHWLGRTARSKGTPVSLRSGPLRRCSADTLVHEPQSEDDLLRWCCDQDDSAQRIPWRKVFQLR